MKCDFRKLVMGFLKCGLLCIYGTGALGLAVRGYARTKMTKLQGNVIANPLLGKKNARLEKYEAVDEFASFLIAPSVAMSSLILFTAFVYLWLLFLDELFKSF